jgi:hypothetical protein
MACQRYLFSWRPIPSLIVAPIAACKLAQRYGTAVPHAIGVTRLAAALLWRDNLIVETRLGLEPAWKALVESHHTRIALLLCAVQPRGGVL